MTTHKIKLAVICCCLTVLLFPFGTFGQRRAPRKPASPTPAISPPTTAPKDYDKFLHSQHLGQVSIPNTGQTRELKCDSCHQRGATAQAIVATTARNQRLGLKFPGHQACVECHITQFTEQPQQTCAICHQTKGAQNNALNNGLPARPPQRDFPPRSDFNALFDTRQHEQHLGYSFTTGQKLDCNFCHQQTAKPAVLNIASHQECYVCHTPQSGDAKAAQKSGCVVCHTTMQPNPQPFSASYVSRAYGAQFTHKAHVQFLNGNCAACHTISGDYNQPVPTSLKVKQHLSPAERSGRGCFSCHDGGMHYGRKVFSGEPGGEGGGSCNRCHTRNDFKVLPSSG